ncbi:MAG: cell envelope integrity protein CreD [Muribaculaceae bacterium]|nr:cell envelope integrity protein CreD [Muribaculaceae bacterium]
MSQLPPPYPVNFTPPPPVPEKKKSYGMKALFLGLQCALLMVGVLAVWILLYSRENNERHVSQEISNEWGGAVHIKGPLIKLSADSDKSFLPETFVCKANVDTKSLHRNIYETEVFLATVNISETFDKNLLPADTDTLYLRLEVNPVHITNLSPLKVGRDSLNWSRYEHGLYAEINVAHLPDKINFSTSFDIRGSEQLYIVPIGKDSKITIEGEAPNPSFKGNSLPVERRIDGKEFFALWESSGNETKISPDNDCNCVGTWFLVGVDRYQKVHRSLKYAFFFIFLTYLSVFFIDVLKRRDIPLLNYFLIGAALIIFYTLLLSFAEHLSFGLSYLIASAMTILLITAYMWKMLRSRKSAAAIGLILVGEYSSCYVMLSLSAYALLYGSLLLFIVLACMMYGSLRLNR